MIQNISFIVLLVVFREMALSSTGEEEQTIRKEGNDQYNRGQNVLDVIEVIHFYVTSAIYPITAIYQSGGNIESWKDKKEQQQIFPKTGGLGEGPR